MTLEIIPLEGLPEVEPGDDLAALLEPSLASHRADEGDVIAVTQKIVSKSEGRIVPGRERASWVDRESVGVVARRGDLLITRTRHGFVCANAGVDASNVREGFLTLLPEDPDASAERLQKELSARLGLTRLGVVITDTFGRPWREGVVDVAIGCAGLPPLIDLRGTADDHGTTLEATVVALADAVAAASGLVMTKTARVPAALVRGLDAAIGDAPAGPARALVRARADDLFWESALVAASVANANATFGPGDVPPNLVEEAVRAASGVPSLGDWTFVALTSATARRRLLSVVGDADDALRSAPVLIVPCVEVEGGRTSAPRTRHQGRKRRSSSPPAPRSGRSWSPCTRRASGRGGTRTTRLDADGVRAALELGADRRPLGIVAVGPMPEGGA